MIRHDDNSDAGMAGWTSPFKAAAKGVAKGAKAVGKGVAKGAGAVGHGAEAAGKTVASVAKKGAVAGYKAGRWGVKMNIKAFVLLNKTALKGFCMLPGPARAVAIGGALTAGTGGAGGAAAPVVSQAAANAVCKAMASGKQADFDAAQQLLASQGNIDFAPSSKSWWDELLELLGIK